MYGGFWAVWFGTLVCLLKRQISPHAGIPKKKKVTTKSKAAIISASQRIDQYNEPGNPLELNG